MIALKESRHILFITYPLILAAALLLKYLTTRLFLGSLSVVAVALAVMVSGLVSDRPPDVTGVRQAARYIGIVAPQETDVAFWGRMMARSSMACARIVVVVT